VLKMEHYAIGLKFFQRRGRIHAAYGISGCFVLIIFAMHAIGPLPNENRETVIILHGLGRTSFSMQILKNRLQHAGYRVISKSYASTQGAISDHVVWLEGLLDECDREDNVPTHFVTHSLGGIVVRKYLAKHPMANLGRVVMLSPPNQGSEVADCFKDWKLFHLAMGPSGQELGTENGSTPNALGPVEFELGVITGDASLNPVTSWLIPGPDDGAVAVRSAKVDGMTDFWVVHRSHTFIMNASEVADEVIAFLKTGSFTHSTTPS
jgi:triacylglycerol lipase